MRTAVSRSPPAARLGQGVTASASLEDHDGLLEQAAGPLAAARGERIESRVEKRMTHQQGFTGPVRDGVGSLGEPSGLVLVTAGASDVFEPAKRLRLAHGVPELAVQPNALFEPLACR